ncbi:hypothetical protein OF83DRAFT_1185908, partial [Amylostereum chailletii]
FNRTCPSHAEFDEFDEDAEAEADLDPDFDDNFDLEFEDDEDKYKYGQLIPSRLLNGGEGGGRRDRRRRRRSIMSTQSLSPLSENPLARARVDSPFNINRPPEEDMHAVRPSSLPTPFHAHAHMHMHMHTHTHTHTHMHTSAHANGADGRTRGDSTSTTGTQSSAGLRTPAPALAHLASVASPAPSMREIDYPVVAAYPLLAPMHRSVPKLAHAPEPVFGAMPLSACLVAYGESLALERQLREGSSARRASEVCAGRETPFGMKPRSTSVSGLGSQEEVDGMSEYNAVDHGLQLDLGTVASLEMEVPRMLSASASSSAFFASRTPNASMLVAAHMPDTSTLFAPHPAPASASDRDTSRSLDASAPMVTLTRSRTPDPSGQLSTVPEDGDAMHLAADLKDCKDGTVQGGDSGGAVADPSVFHVYLL